MTGKFNKRVLAGLLFAGLLLGTSCAATVPTANRDGSMISFTISNLPDSGYYLMENGSASTVFHPLYRLGRNFTNISDTADDTRMVWFVDGKKDLIPVLNVDAGDQLIYRSTGGKFIENYYFELFADQGYTLGITSQAGTTLSDLLAKNKAAETTAADEATPVPTLSDQITEYLSFRTDLICPNSNAAAHINGKDSEVSNWFLYTINGTPYTTKLLDQNGAVLGLQQDANYLVGAYQGTIYKEILLKADAHYFTSTAIRVAEGNNFTLTQSGYIIITIPPDLVDGLYCINGGGIFYVQNSQSK